MLSLWSVNLNLFMNFMTIWINVRTILCKHPFKHNFHCYVGIKVTNMRPSLTRTFITLDLMKYLFYFSQPSNQLFTLIKNLPCHKVAPTFSPSHCIFVLESLDVVYTDKVHANTNIHVCQRKLEVSTFLQKHVHPNKKLPSEPKTDLTVFLCVRILSC